ncbi:Asp-tRNA(Asn)/Glu-tRNA(Gln) amidotransferase subunit GatC [Cerasicoccus arenae]|uniref:Aspartyl/glutamyl-tRNA(Asn/Gln) amidotransferase subunit C n=1 Tax=Cerasicoccus arenae TaxID=424488 RepID=A0A8J3D958_9BACT|nr:Asp-tRNA(Asn)/Glu-tRNA(Gln) amidotransferase subunit GatC [Cerasicoccus arenae]MBK1857092.1 Asp-tRNA(Asn)/Glu-tRNA(Gln) amidotransferase subunit GatC [Cerasicoccus arenae]GHB92317.1 aspartyl/glutamyl-tRNA(Asn/Gln) amidotransferase subunit C [Cerasicoccus arenae]
MAHTEIDIDKVARLARLDLSDEEKRTYSAQLGQVLEHMDKLNALDLDGVEPTAHSFPLSNVLDEDEEQPGFTVEEALRNAPKARDNQVVVPKVVE